MTKTYEPIPGVLDRLGGFEAGLSISVLAGNPSSVQFEAIKLTRDPVNLSGFTIELRVVEDLIKVLEDAEPQVLQGVRDKSGEYEAALRISTCFTIDPVEFGGAPDGNGPITLNLAAIRKATRVLQDIRFHMVVTETYRGRALTDPDTARTLAALAAQDIAQRMEQVRAAVMEVFGLSDLGRAHDLRIDQFANTEAAYAKLSAKLQVTVLATDTMLSIAQRLQDQAKTRRR